MRYVFFLGGQDLEMLRIKDVLTHRGWEFFDKKLSWGAKASSYQQEIAEVTSQGKTPVLIELELDIELPASAIVVDHHGDRSGEPASLIQVLKLASLDPPSKWDLFVSANDSGYIPAMIAVGARDFEIRAVRRADREAQGVTAEMERQAMDSIIHAEKINGVVVVRLPHEKCSSVTDRLFTSWPDGKENLLVICEIGAETTEIDYFGRGDLCKALKETFSGWGGGKGFGDPQGNGFSGCRTKDVDSVVNFVTNF